MTTTISRARRCRRSSIGVQWIQNTRRNSKHSASLQHGVDAATPACIHPWAAVCPAEETAVEAGGVAAAAWRGVAGRVSLRRATTMQRSGWTAALARALLAMNGLPTFERRATTRVTFSMVCIHVHYHDSYRLTRRSRPLTQSHRRPPRREEPQTISGPPPIELDQASFTTWYWLRSHTPTITTIFG
jgi:hypothetical protein